MIHSVIDNDLIQPGLAIDSQWSLDVLHQAGVRWAARDRYRIIPVSGVDACRRPRLRTEDVDRVAAAAAVERQLLEVRVRRAKGRTTPNDCGTHRVNLRLVAPCVVDVERVSPGAAIEEEETCNVIQVRVGASHVYRIVTRSGGDSGPHSRSGFQNVDDVAIPTATERQRTKPGVLHVTPVGELTIVTAHDAVRD